MQHAEVGRWIRKIVGVGRPVHAEDGKMDLVRVESQQPKGLDEFSVTLVCVGRGEHGSEANDDSVLRQVEEVACLGFVDGFEDGGVDEVGDDVEGAFVPQRAGACLAGQPIAGADRGERPVLVFERAIDFLFATPDPGIDVQTAVAWGSIG